MNVPKSLDLLRRALNDQQNRLSAARATVVNIKSKLDAQKAEVETLRQSVEDLEEAIRTLEAKGSE